MHIFCHIGYREKGGSITKWRGLLQNGLYHTGHISHILHISNTLHILHIMHIRHIPYFWQFFCAENDFSALPGKIARFLHECHHTAYASLQSPPIPLDWSRINVHGILLQHQVPDIFQYGDRDSARVWRI